jgi:hypothetical protein
VAIPYTFAMDGDLTIDKIYDGWRYVNRPAVEELREDFRRLLSRRPDWAYADDWDHTELEAAQKNLEVLKGAHSVKRER